MTTDRQAAEAALADALHTITACTDERHIRPRGTRAYLTECELRAGALVRYLLAHPDAARAVAAALIPDSLDRERAESAPSLRAAAQAYLDWRDKRAAQWDAVAHHDHEHGSGPCSEWDELVNEPFDIDQRLDDAIRAALRATDTPSLDAAWRAAEEALPERWSLHGVRRGYVGAAATANGPAWSATAQLAGIGVEQRRHGTVPNKTGTGPTPAAALRALAAVLALLEETP